MIRFNHPYLFGPELDNVKEAIRQGRLAGNGTFTKKCHHLLEERYQFAKCLLTTSCTDALEMAAILLDIQPGDEVIVPSYTFVSSANAFVLRGAKIVFADSYEDHPNVDHTEIENLISEKTKAIVVVHYGGIACNMNAIMKIASSQGIYVIEDAAQSIDTYFDDRALGSIGHLAAFSFHETKNVVSGEGGMLVINDPRFADRAEVIWEKGTNRSAFFRGETDKYGWVDVGSSFLPSDLIAAYLFGQLQFIDEITKQRVERWKIYHSGFESLEKKGLVKRPILPEYATNNGHVYYLQCASLGQRTGLLAHLKSKEIGAVFHYLSLHKSPFYKEKHDGREMPHADRFTDTLVRLPMHLHLTEQEMAMIIKEVEQYFGF